MFIHKFYHCSIKVDLRNIKVVGRFQVLLVGFAIGKNNYTDCLLTQQQQQKQKKTFRLEDRIKPSSILKLLLIATFMTPKFSTNSTLNLYRLKIIFQRIFGNWTLRF